jgi:peptide/nickel transport system substrate-binding protein
MRRHFLLSAALSLILLGCNSPVSQVQPQTGGILREALVGDPTTFNPALARQGASLTVARLLFVGLVAPPDDKGAVQPELASKWQMGEGGRVWRLTLRPGLIWSDGKPLTAADVVYSYGKVYLTQAASYGLDAGMRVSAPDPESVEFALSAPDARLLERLHLPVLPEHALAQTASPFETWGLDTDPATLPVNGPFRATAYAPGERLDLRANPAYWRSGEKQPYLAGVALTIAPDRATALALFRSGKLDDWLVAPDEYAPLSATQGSEVFTLVNGGPSVGGPLLVFNLNQGKRGKDALVDPAHARWFASRAFRRAVAFALDRRTMAEVAWLNTAKPADHPFDQEKAKALLAEAGLRPGSDGRLQDGTGNPVRFSLVVDGDSPPMVALAARVVADLEVLGIAVDLKPLPRNVLRNRLRATLAWEAALFDPALLGAAPLDREALWRSDSPWHLFNLAGSGLQGRTIAPWEERLDSLVAATHREGDTTAAQSELQALLSAEQPVIETVHPLAIAAVRPTVRGGMFNARGLAHYGRVFTNIWQVEKAPDAPANPS